MEKVNWKVAGMSCTNCALTVNKYLTGKGLQGVQVNFMDGNLSFEINQTTDKKELAKGIEGLGYQVITGEEIGEQKPRKLFQNHFQRFLFCIVFTAPLLLHMIPGVHLHFLMNPYVQLGLTIPVFLVGMDFFGRSAWHSLLTGIPNMNVLIAIGAVSAFGYSLYGTIIGDAEHYLFYETAATILTLVFLGNWMEEKSIETTQTALKKLVISKKQMANMIAYDDKHQEHVFPVESGALKVGDLVLIGNGEAIPMDCKVLWGEASVDESIITGESTPVEKKMNDLLIGGSVVASGTLKAYVTAVGQNTVLANILILVKAAQTEKPPIQQLADRISAIFVPVVISLALLTILGNYFIAQHPFSESLLRGIAVLVISCPCAMGLATPAAIAVGLGRAARNGVLFKNAKSLEIFKQIKQVVFDKTGTLTTGQFSIDRFKVLENVTDNGEAEFQKIAFSLEKYSSHPIGKSISKTWKVKDDIRWAKVEEIRGLGMRAIDKAGNEYQAVSFKGISTKHHDHSHNVYITRNGELLGWIDVVDEIRPEAALVIEQLRAAGIRTILLSGDTKAKCEQVANTLHIDEWMAEQSPQQKMDAIAKFNKQEPTAMIGDGINDAPALAKATVGISLSDASHIAMQSAQVVLMNHGLKNLPLALGLGKHTYSTIQQNLFWAFIYNIIAIPVAAFGYLSPGFGALVMGLSDVVLAINSIRLNYKKVV